MESQKLNRLNFIKTTATLTAGLFGLSGINQTLMANTILQSPSNSLASAMQGVWWLMTREDYTKEGQKRIDPTLGADPIGILT